MKRNLIKILALFTFAQLSQYNVSAQTPIFPPLPPPPPPSTSPTLPTPPAVPLDFERRVASYESPGINLRIIPISNLNNSQIASFSVEMSSPVPTETRLRMFVDNATGKEVFSSTFPEVISLPSANTVYSRTWRITNNATTTGIGLGTNYFGFESLDITNKFRAAESLALRVVPTPVKPPVASPFPLRSAQEIPPRIDLAVTGLPITNTATTNSNLAQFNVRLWSNINDTSSVTLTVQNEAGQTVYTDNYPQLISLTAGRPVQLPWSIPNNGKTKQIPDGRNFFIFEVKDKLGVTKREETIPVSIKTYPATPLPNPPFAYSPGLILEDSKKLDVPINVEQIKLNEEGHKFMNVLDYYGWDTRYNIYVLKLSATREFWVDNKNTVGGNAKAKLQSWLKNVLLSNYVTDKDNQFYESPSILKDFLGQSPKKDALETIGAFGNFKETFAPNYYIPLDHGYFEISSSIDSFTHRYIKVLVMDPTPNSAPDKEMYLVVISGVYSE